MTRSHTLAAMIIFLSFLVCLFFKMLTFFFETCIVLVLADVLKTIFWPTRYRYRRKKDHPKLFIDAEKIELNIDNKTIAWKGTHTADTAVLELYIKSTCCSRLRLPYVEVSVGEHVIRQDIEAGAKGKRFVNMSNLLPYLKIDTTITLKTCHAKLTINTANCYLFENSIEDNTRYLILSPHPDDAEIAAFGLYSENDANIVTITAGESGPAYYKVGGKEENQLLKGNIRSFDSISVPRFAGKSQENAVNLGYFNGMLHKMRKDPERAFHSKSSGATDIHIFRRGDNIRLLRAHDGKCTWDNLVDDLAHIIDETQPDVIITAHPQMDSHKDHKLTTHAAFDALAQTTHKPSQFFFYVNHLHETNAYPFGPTGSALSTPPFAEADDTLKGKLYSHPLTKRKQYEKTIALSFMHDLKDGPWNAACFYARCKNRFCNMIIGKKESPFGRNPYFQQAVRSNELFYVVDVNT